MRIFTDEDLAELADWAEKSEREEAMPEVRKAYASLRQGADWILRFRVRERVNKTGEAASA